MDFMKQIVPQKTRLSYLGMIKVKTCGKSTRIALVIAQLGKPGGLKAHVYQRLRATRSS